MSTRHTDPGVDLLLDLGGSRRRSALEDALRRAIRAGRLRPGSLLPSSRALAAEVGLSRNTVVDAYGQLIAEGWLMARPGAGTHVAARPVGAVDPAFEAVAEYPAAAPLDLRPGLPDLAAFPRAGWHRAVRHALDTTAAQLLGQPDLRGVLALRTTIADYLARVRGVRTTPERIVICTGFQHALHLLAVTLRRAGNETMALESYGIALHREIVRAAGLRTCGLAVDSNGACLNELAEADAALLTPAHQFPLGVVLAAERRARVLDWARDTGGLVIEDDYDGEFRYDRRPIGALQAHGPDHVAYVGTASKSLAPGLRLAWLVVPPRLLDAVLETKRLTGTHPGTLDQLALDGFVRSGAYDRHIRRSRLHYRRRRDRLVALLDDTPRPTTVTGIAAGLHAVVTLTGLHAAEETAVVTRAERAGLAVHGLSRYRETAADEAHAALVIGYATPPEHAYPAALHALRGTLSPR